MKKVIEVIEKLRTISGNEQISFLKEHVYDELLKEILRYTYNDNKYNINEDKYNKVDVLECEEKLPADTSTWIAIRNQLDELANKKSAKDKDVKDIKTIIENCENPKFFRQILFKDLRINMGVKTFNKVYGDFCIKFPYLGARPFNMKNLEAIKFPAFGQLKADGLFCNAIIDPLNKVVQYYSRQGKPIDIHGSLDEELLKIKANEKFVITGEVLVYDNKTNKPLPRKVSNGIVRRENKTKEELDNIKIMAWDFIPYNNFLEKEWKVPYNKRFEVLNQMSKMSSDRLLIVESRILNNIDEALDMFNELYEKGLEGIVVKQYDLLWQDKKPKGCVKIKNEDSVDLRMVEFFEGKGNYAKMCGSIKCVSEDKLLEVNVKPRTPLIAQEIWNNQDKYLNKILEVTYNEVIKDKNKDTYSLFLPRFVEIRDLDKDKADKLEDILK